MTREHAEITDAVAALVADSRPPVMESDVEDLRQRGTGLLGMLVRHRQTGADLIYEAFHADVGGVD